MNFEQIGYMKYSETKPQEKLMAECIDEHGLSWTAQIGPEGGGGGLPYWWRPVLSKDDLWRRVVELESIKYEVRIEGGGAFPPSA